MKREKTVNMKKKRITALLSSALITAATVLTVYASSSVSGNFYYSNNIDAYVHGYIDFLEGPLWLQDKVWCNVSLNGPDWSCVSAVIAIKKDKAVIKKGTLQYDMKSYSCSGKTTGYGGTNASLTINYDKKFAVLQTDGKKGSILPMK